MAPAYGPVSKGIQGRIQTLNPAIDAHTPSPFAALTPRFSDTECRKHAIRKPEKRYPLCRMIPMGTPRSPYAIYILPNMTDHSAFTPLKIKPLRRSEMTPM